MNTANGKEMIIQVHETCITDFLKDFKGCVNVLSKEYDLYTIKAFIMDKTKEKAEVILKEVLENEEQESL